MTPCLRLINVKQTPSQATETPISFLDYFKFDFTNILIPLGLFFIFLTIPWLNIIPLNILFFIKSN